MQHALIAQIAFHLPSQCVTNDQIAVQHPDWKLDVIARKTGIFARHITARDECASDLAFAAASKLFDAGAISREQIDYILLCTQSPDYLLPTTACILQDRLKLSKSCGAMDINLGCSGFIYGLGLCEGLICSGQAERILFLTADTYTKYINSNDKSSLVLFGDGAAATLVVASSCDHPAIGPFIYGTDGSGAADLILIDSATRITGIVESRVDSRDAQQARLHMSGNKIFQFAVETVPQVVRSLLAKSSMRLEDIDLLVLHQANGYVIEEIRKRLGMSSERVPLILDQYANTVSSTIPIALSVLQSRGKLRQDSVLMLVGFGVGLSWGATLVRWGLGEPSAQFVNLGGRHEP
jgi:3-oxoacyl-[acyl-carrier-protein] synthase-3